MTVLLGYPNIAIRAISSVVAPAGLPSDIQARLSQAVNESLRMDSTKKTLAMLGFTGKGSTPKELAEVIQAQLVSWGGAVKAAGLRPE